MSKKKISFVIDADIAKSSGLSEHPVSSGSRKLLESLRESGHKAVMCPKLREEWSKHKSLFATKWLSSMTAKRQIIRVTPPQKTKKFIEDNISDGKDKDITIKDSHLIDATLETDKIIASNDETARNAFRRLSKKNGEIGTVIWFNAVSDREHIQEKITSDDFIPNEYYLRTPN